MRRGMRPLSQGIRPLSNLALRTAAAALERAALDARSMPGNLLPHERLDELTAAARRIVAEVERLPEARYDLTGAGDRPVHATVAGLLVGRRLELRGDSLRQLGLGLFLMDVGKLALPPAIADKQGPLDHAELELMRRHPQHGLDLVRGVELGPGALAVIRCHHERWDGDGYPAGLAGAETPLPARIAGLADAFVATSSQPAGAAALRASAGSAFDPELVAVFEDVAMARSSGLGAVAA
jgi:HD-GYP domain-containing protein (c-di-GMP phosphodiesterase class II)